TVDVVSLGNLIAKNQKFYVMPSDQEGGTLGTDFLAGYDIEVDPAHKKVNWFSQNHCKGQVVYWTQNYIAIPFTFDSNMHIILPVTVDGQTMQAAVDTGVHFSYLSARAAKVRLGLTPESDTTKPEGKVRFAAGGQAFASYRHLFSSMDIGGITFRNTELDVV